MAKINNKIMKYLLFIESTDKKIEKKVKEFSENIFSKIKLIDGLIVIVDFQNNIKQGKLNYDFILET